MSGAVLALLQAMWPSSVAASRVHLPLNCDFYFLTTITAANSAPWCNFVGNGQAAGQIIFTSLLA